jgi:putative ABC transport system substrate-binding protein
VPAATTIGFLVNPTNPSEAAGETVGEAVMREAVAVARLLGVRLVTLNAGTPIEIEAAFTIVSEQRISALLVSGDPLFSAQHDQLAALATRHAVAAIYAVPRTSTRAVL